MITEADIAEGRAIAESEMVDECVVLRSLGTHTDPDSGVVVEDWATVYSGKCRLRMTASVPTQREVAEQLVTVTKPLLQVPWTEDDFKEGDRAVMTASRSPGLVDRAVQVAGPWLQTTSAACRYPCIESTIPEPEVQP